MSKKLTQKEAFEKILNRCKEIDCRLVDENFIYTKNSMRLKLICNKDNYGAIGEWTPSYKKFIKGIGCPKCAGNAKLTQEEAEEQVLSRCKEMNYSLRNCFTMKNCYTKIPLKCNIDNHEWTPRYDNFINEKNGCPKCAGNLHLTQEDADKKIEIICKKMNYILLESFIYKNNESIIKLKCNIDSHVWEPDYGNFILEKRNCRKCSGCLKISQKEAEEKILERCKEVNYTLYENFIMNSTGTKISLKCNKCNHKWNPTYNSFIYSKKGCPVCKLSHGELEVKKYLEKNYSNLFEMQKKFEECKNIKKLPFDFYIDKYKIAIEYQGKQHYFDNYFIKHKDISISIRDNIKKQYCIDNNIFLIEIPYIIKLKEIPNFLNKQLEYYFNCIKNVGYVI